MQSRSFPKELSAFVFVTLSSTVISWLVVFVGRLSGAGSPYQSMWFPEGPWMDYEDYFHAFRLLHTQQFFTVPSYPFTQFPPMVFLYRFFYQFGLFGGFLAYLAFDLIPCAFAMICFRRAVLRRGFTTVSVDKLILTLLIGAYPLTYCLQRGNLEIILAIGLATGMWAYCKGRSFTAAVIWGLCGAAKIYPFLLLALFEKDRRYREIMVALATALGANLVGLIYLGPTISVAFRGIRSGLQSFLGLYALRYDWLAMGYDHSFFSFIKMCVRPSVAELPTLLHFYMPAMALGMLALYFLRIRDLSFANRVLFLAVVSISMPPTSADYTLLQLYAPLAILILLLADGRLFYMTPVLCVLALVMTPLNIWFRDGVSLQGSIRSVLLAVLIWLTARRDFANPWTSKDKQKHWFHDDPRQIPSAAA